MTRVFNVSHHRCATTSVHNALGILGFDSHHWERSSELMQSHLEGTVEQEPFFQPDNSAFNDLPVTLMYRELYRVFPHDKFLFVRRDRSSWFESLRQHLLLRWPEPLPIHTVVYGYPIKADSIDEAVCLRAYDRITEDILGFFQGKSNFLLIELEDLSWKSLCPFLEKPEPDQPFPWHNKSLEPVRERLDIVSQGDSELEARQTLAEGSDRAP